MRLCYRWHVPNDLQEAAMIPRYTRATMAQIWAPETRFRIWFEIEAHAASAMAELGLIPKSAAKVIWDKGSKAKFDTAVKAAETGCPVSKLFKAEISVSARLES